MSKWKSVHQVSIVCVGWSARTKEESNGPRQSRTFLLLRIWYGNGEFLVKEFP